MRGCTGTRGQPYGVSRDVLRRLGAGVVLRLLCEEECDEPPDEEVVA